MKPGEENKEIKGNNQTNDDYEALLQKIEENPILKPRIINEGYSINISELENPENDR